MAGNIVQDQALLLKVVTQDVAQVNKEIIVQSLNILNFEIFKSMASGDPGLPGLPAASHVAQEQDLAQEVAAVLDLTVVEKVAQDQAS